MRKQEQQQPDQDDEKRRCKEQYEVAMWRSKAPRGGVVFPGRVAVGAPCDRRGGRRGRGRKAPRDLDRQASPGRHLHAAW